MEYTPTQRVVQNLIVEDLRFIYSVFLVNKKITRGSYFVALQPYLGLIADGIEQWSGKIQPLKYAIPRFSKDEKAYYINLRNNIKLWDTNLTSLIKCFKNTYQSNDNYFSSICNPIAKHLKLYDIYECFIINGHFCDNTILDSIYTPYFKLGNLDGNYIKSMSTYLGQLVKIFGAHEPTPIAIDTTAQIKTQDYCGFLPSPTGHRDYDKSFLLFSIMCSINFLVFGIDKYVLDETPTKLRFAYVQYFYLVNLIKDINIEFNSHFSIDARWYNMVMRNCLAHYGLGNSIKQNEVDETDAFGGLTNKLFHCEWQILKQSLFNELWSLSEQLRIFLKIK